MQHLGLKLSHILPGLRTGIFTPVCNCPQYLWNQNHLFLIVFSSSAATFVLDQMELLSLVVIVIFLTPLAGMKGWAQSVWLWHWQISHCSQGDAQMLQRWTIWAAPALEAINRNFLNNCDWWGSSYKSEINENATWSFEPNSLIFLFPFLQRIP